MSDNSFITIFRHPSSFRKPDQITIAWGISTDRSLMRSDCDCFRTTGHPGSYVPEQTVNDAVQKSSCRKLRQTSSASSSLRRPTPIDLIHNLLRPADGICYRAYCCWYPLPAIVLSQLANCQNTCGNQKDNDSRFSKAMGEMPRGGQPKSQMEMAPPTRSRYPACYNSSTKRFSVRSFMGLDHRNAVPALKRSQHTNVRRRHLYPTALQFGVTPEE